jgi:hypothetical protein
MPILQNLKLRIKTILIPRVHFAPNKKSETQHYETTHAV